MKYEIVPNSCRVCLRKGKKLRSFFTAKDEGDETPREMLEQITGIVLENEEENTKQPIALPKRICKTCELSLNLAFQFRMKALKSQRLIDIYCSHHLNEISESFNNDTNIKEELDDDCLDLLGEDYMQIEELNLDRKTNVEELNVDSAAHTILADERTENTEYLDESYLDLDECDKYAQIESVQTNSDLYSCDKADNLGDVSDVINEGLSTKLLKRKKVKTNKIAARRGRKPKIKSNELMETELLEELSIEDVGYVSNLKESKPVRMKRINGVHNGYICDICGNIFSARGRMMEHRRRHDKELRFACELCDKRFQLREYLRKHMYSHSGGKPYKCNFCSRTFFYESVRKAHEAVHQGHKPYVCNVQNCKKAFAYSQALSKHKLIHDNIKLYHCEYCRKDFRLQHHMKQHMETKTHQAAKHLAEIDAGCVPV